MPGNCSVNKCSNVSSRNKDTSFHKFPFKNPKVLNEWVVRISREEKSGKPWQPTEHSKVCSEHFLESDFYKGLARRRLRDEAVPSQRLGLPTHKEEAIKKKDTKRKAPAERQFNPAPVNVAISAESFVLSEHSYHHASVETHLDKVQSELHKAQEKLASKSKELKNVKGKVSRRENRIESLLKDLEKSIVLRKEVVDLLSYNFDRNTLYLIENEVNALSTTKNNVRYSDELKSFATTLHFYSSQAYNFVRKHIHLPHPDTIRKWSTSLNVEPGFLTEVIEKLKTDVQEDSDMKDVVLMFDSMSIKKEVIYDKKKQCYSGFVDLGNIMCDADEQLASESLVFLVVGMKKYFKIPIGYFLVHKVGAKEQAQLVKGAIGLLTEAGLNVQAVVCDGAYSNQSTATILGCKLTENEMKTTFPNHYYKDSEEIHFLFDACHLIKNIRNCLGDVKVLYSDGDEINWKYIEALHELQLNYDVHLANKLRGKHIHYEKNKMKVCFATQTLSSSVAAAIEFCRDELHLPQFFGSEATCNFIRWFDKIFDLCNSKSVMARGYKGPIKRENMNLKMKTIEMAAAYIRTLQLKQGDALKSVLTSRRKTGFIGFLTTLKTIASLSQKLLGNGGFHYILTYRMSQDHLETLFSRIRRRGGWNNNPNALQFKYAIRTLLQKNGVSSSANGNCVEFFVDFSTYADQLPRNTVPSNDLISDTEAPSMSSETAVVNSEHKHLVQLLEQKGPYHLHVLHYIAGFIVKKLLTKTDCLECMELLVDSGKSNSDVSGFTRKRDKGGLKFASSDTFKVVELADKEFRRQLSSLNSLREVSPNVISKVLLCVTKEMSACVFRSHSSCHHPLTEEAHSIWLIKEISKLLCTIFIYNTANIYTQRLIHKDQVTSRHCLTKKIIFLGH